MYPCDDTVFKSENAIYSLLQGRWKTSHDEQRSNTEKHMFDFKQIVFSLNLQIQRDLPQLIQGVSLQGLKSH